MENRTAVENQAVKAGGRGVLSSLEPQGVFSFFEQLSAVPRTSHHTEKISAWLEDFAHERNLPCVRDASGNILIRQGGTCGLENEPAVILQGHMDMVGDKKPGSDHDFLTEGLDLFIEGDLIGARDTTLGGDDGIAAAIGLAILDDPSIPHPPLELLITVDEEVGLLGADAFDASLLKGRQMLNLDSEDEGIFTCGCAGGLEETTSLPLSYEASEGLAVTVVLDHLKGGHSGQMINEGRGNADKLLAHFLTELKETVPYRLMNLSGGSKDNAIPFRAEAQILTEAEDLEKVKAAAASCEEKLRQDFAGTDDGAEMTVSAGKVGPKRVMKDVSRDRILKQMEGMPYGVLAMSEEIPGLVETSTNVGVMKVEEDHFKTVSSCRSSKTEGRDGIRRMIEEITEDCGGTATAEGIYPPWVYRQESPLRDKAVRIFREMYGRDPEVNVIHAGLECGIFDSRIEGLDAISLGPDMQDIHTFRERLSISSVQRVFAFTLKMLSER